MGWRYHPVFVDGKSGRGFGLCEVHFDDEGRVKSWTAEPFMAPLGDDIDDLSAEIMHMIIATFSWEPVNHANLRVGMVLKHRISMIQREALAKMVENMAVNLKAAQTSPQGPEKDDV